MSLGIAFKGPEGIVLAVDSRVTLTNATKQSDGETFVQQFTFDNAEKLLRFEGHPYVGAITYGLGAIGTKVPRTANSYLPEFEQELGSERLGVEAFCKKLSEFFVGQWAESGLPEENSVDLIFLVGGYDEDEPHGRVFEILIPNFPEPVELIPNEFGVSWGGQPELTNRVIHGFDPSLPHVIQDMLNIPENSRNPNLAAELQGKLSLAIPWQFLPLQDCVDLCIFLVEMTIRLQRWMVATRGVGGVVDVATITRTDGFEEVQKKRVTGSYS